MVGSSSRTGVELLRAFTAAWNRHDIDALMSFMTEDCVFETASGDEACGTRVEGADAVRRRFEQVWKTIRDARWDDGRHFVAGDRGASEWTFSGTRPDGRRIVVDGCDLFTFREGRIVVKSTYLKQRHPLPGDSS